MLNYIFCYCQSLKSKADYQEQTGLNVLPLRSLDGQRTPILIIIAFPCFPYGAGAPECHQPLRSVPQTLNFQHSSQVPLRPSRSSAWIQRRTGPALCVSRCVSITELVDQTLPSLHCPASDMWGQGWGTGGKPEHQDTNTHSTIPKDGKFVALRFWSQSHSGCNSESVP